MSDNIAIIGIGTAGCIILDKLNTTCKKIFIDTEASVVEKYSGIMIGPEITKKFQGRHIISTSELAAKESKQVILDEIQNFNKIIIVAPLGGAAGGAAKRIAEFSVDE